MSSQLNRVRRRVVVAGVVQGVGFRPYVYRLAQEEHLSGAVSNGPAGVTIEVEGEQKSVAEFLRRLPIEIPPLARVASLEVSDLPLKGSREFNISASDTGGHVDTQIPADAATCDDCIRELLDPSDRRYRYPFINCTNCGPRFTITRSIPYDRPQTSMAAFGMCPECQAEYDDPRSRRFHAQPNACWRCGPQLELKDRQGVRIDSGDPVTVVIERLLVGDIVAIKGIGGFHLAVDATNESAVNRLRERKHRFGKPLAVMLPTFDAAKRHCYCDDSEQALLAGVERPIVLLKRRGIPALADSVAPGLPWLGVFLPYAPLHHLLFTDSRVKALVMTSANLSDEPIAIDNVEAVERLGGIADLFLMNNRDILQRCDDSVLAVVEGRPQFLRRARGFVPLPLPLPIPAPPLLAVGGQMKNVFCLASGGNAYQSQHLGELENFASLEFFGEALSHLKRTFEIQPETIACDLHPGYLSTQWAQRQGLPIIGVQHHHAHIASSMAEHALAGPVIGIALDGTGYGTDGQVWGGEVLIATMDSFTRFAHQVYVAMPGSSAAIREPWRMALGHLLAAGVEITPEILSLLKADEREVRLLSRMVKANLNSPLTSSCGRLFDAAAALITGRSVAEYEAQAAIELEARALDAGEDDDRGAAYTMNLVKPIADGAPWQLDTAAIWPEVLEDLRKRVPAPLMSMRFHTAVAQGYAQAAIAARDATGIHEVCLSGGVFHNALLTHLLRRALVAAAFEVFLHSRVSPGDGGLSYGQAAVAAATLESRKT